MPRWQRVYLAACGGVIGFAIAYVASDFGPLPRLTYVPDGGWRIATHAGDPAAMPYYGMLLWGLAGGVVGAALVAVASRFARAEAPARWLHLAGAWAITAAALGAGYFVWNLWPF
jgi:hypothetical protein